jgi:hypothetical protein
MGERLSYGPYPVGKNTAEVMQMVSGFIPVQGPHIEQAELCATCHNLYTPYLDANDEIAGEFPEQTIYQEWLGSGYSQEISCQGCHMPQAQGAVQISITGGPPRQPFYQHVFVGGNAYMMMGIFQVFGPEMDVTASSNHYANTHSAIVEQLGQRTASLSLEDFELENGMLKGLVRIESQVGHKFPAGFPSRRAWLHIQVLDVNGDLVFESGAVTPDGSIEGNDNDFDATTFEPHYLEINSPDQVQIYESIMLNSEGQLTTTLLRGASYGKDNRLLPAGFDKSKAVEDIAVYGVALDDSDFLSGGDVLSLAIALDAAQGPFTVKVELLYQSIGFRWADNLRQFQAEEIDRFIGYYDSVSNLPLIVDSLEQVVE